MSARSARHIDAITLDFYGTLIHPRNGRGRGSNLVEYTRGHDLEPAPWEHRMLYDLFDRHDTEYSPDLPEDARRDYLEQLARRAFDILEIQADDRLAKDHAVALWRIIGPDAFALYPETRTVLDTLKSEGYPLALVSNWQRGLEHFCTELGIADAFDHVISSAELGIAKPDRRIFDEACSRLGAEPEHVLHVGDTLADDYEGGRAAGLQTILVHRSPEPPPDGIDAIDDLQRLLPRLPGS